MSTWSAGDVHVDYRFGTWTPVITSRPSNYREFLNMVMEIEMFVCLTATGGLALADTGISIPGRGAATPRPGCY